MNKANKTPQSNTQAEPRLKPDRAPESQASQTEAKITELTADLQRTRADFENFRKQVELQKQQYGNIVKLNTVSKILPILDDIDRAVSAHPEQLGPIVKNIEKAINSIGLQRIPAEIDSEFNPDLHEAVSSEGDGDTELIAEVLRPGYQYDGEVLRPAMVRVKKQS